MASVLLPVELNTFMDGTHPDQTIRTWKLIDVNIDQWGARVGEFLAVGPALWKLMPAWQPGQIATQYVDSKRYRHKKRT